MKNFLRALRYAWPYRVRLVISIVCAVFAAILWGLNFTSIYPVLKLLNNDQSPQQWVDSCIANCNKEIEQIEAVSDALNEKSKELEKLPLNKHVEQQRR